MTHKEASHLIDCKLYEQMLMSKEATLYKVKGLWYKALYGYFHTYPVSDSNFLVESNEEEATKLLAEIEEANSKYVWVDTPSSDTCIDHFTVQWDKFPYQG